MLTVALIGLIIFLIIGVPVSFSLMLSGIIAALVVGDMPLYLVARNIVSGLDSFPLMAAPFFILAGDLMSHGGMSQKIVRFARSLIGHVSGGTAVTTVVSSMIFAGISGSAAAGAAAIGTLVTPDMVDEGYERGFIAPLIACAGAIGPIIPPSLNMIVYASVTGDSIGKMFMGGIGPGVLIGGGLMLYSIWYAKKMRIPKSSWTGFGPYSKAVLTELKEAVWALIAPIIIVGGILAGIFTATEAGIVACVYSILCGFLIYKTLTWKGIARALSKTVCICGMIMLIMAAARIYGYIFAVEGVGAALSDLLLSFSTNPYILLFIIFCMMIVLGFFLEMLAVLVVMIPAVYPLLSGLGLDPIHFGVLLCIASVYGSLTPPVGIQLFVTMAIVKVRMSQMLRHLYPMVIIMCIVVILAIFFPGIVTFLPGLVS